MKEVAVPLLAVLLAVPVGLAPTGHGAPKPDSVPDVLTVKHWVEPVIGNVTVPVKVGLAKGAAPLTAPTFRVSYVPSPLKNVVVVPGKAGKVPAREDVAGLTRLVSWALVSPP